MFKGKIVSRTNINGKVHTFQKDFDDYDAYQEFLSTHPEFNQNLLGAINPWRMLDRFMGFSTPLRSELPAESKKYLPEGIDLDKYEKRREEKRQKMLANAERCRSLECGKAYLEEYLAENADDKEAQKDLEAITKELKDLEK